MNGHSIERWLLWACVVILVAVLTIFGNYFVTKQSNLESKLAATVAVANSAQQTANMTSITVDKLAESINNLAKQIAVSNTQLAVLIDRSSREGD